MQDSEALSMEAGRRVKRAIVTFVLFTFAFSSLGYVATIVDEETSVLLLISPGVAALITRFIYYRNARGFGWSQPEPRWALLAYALPFVVSGSMFILAWLFLGYYTTDKTDTSVLEGLAISSTVVFVLISVFGFGEELGWRGFLVPELAKLTNFRNVALISGAIWAVWHWPLILFAAETTDFDKAPVWFILPVFSVTIVAPGLSWPGSHCVRVASGRP